MEATEWHNYGTESGNPRCANCMVHSGYEASGVNFTFGSLKGLMATAKAVFFSKYEDEQARQLLDSEEFSPMHKHGPSAPLVQLEVKPPAYEGTIA